ncbi:MAG TPA: TonB-dependent receptor [Candidatus Angelobacter sp.]|nr:TonB-dependent receptor [Candidatus Angelobacter sp.]
MPRLRRFYAMSWKHSNSIPVCRGVGQRKHDWARLALTLLLATVFTLAGVQAAQAQEDTGAIVGTVVDQSGAAVKGATVTVKDVDRGTSLNTESNEDGAFNLPRVPVGTYDITVTASGFQSARHAKVKLILNQTARLEFQMKVGQTSETVEVTAEAPVLETDTSLLGSLIDSKAAVELPLSTHNTNQLTLIASPGVVTPNLFGFQAAQNTFGTGRPYVNGAREQENNFVLDGMDNNQPDNNDVGFVPSPEAVQEFNLITGNAPADFGNYLGGVVNLTLKSGTNAFHGGIYEYLRRGGLNANSWSNNLNGVPRPGLRYDDFGGTIGGPIVRNKLFFFADYQESLFKQPQTVSQLQTIPLAQRGGDFSALCTAGFTGGVCNNPAQQLYDPASSANPATRTPFLNNHIPTGRFSNAANNIITSSFYSSLPQLATNVSRFKTNSYQGDLKIDFVPSDKDHVMGRWSQQWVTAPNTNSIQLLGDSDRTFPLKNFVVDETHTFTANLVNDARAGFAYFPVTEGFSNPTGVNLPQKFGIASVSDTFLPALVFVGSGLQPGTIGNNDLVQSFHDTTWQFEDTMFWTRGRHQFHFGMQGYHYIMNDLYPGNAGLAGQFTFNGQFTGNTGTTGGSPVADFLLGLPEDVQQGNGGGGNKYLRNSLFGIFGQDNWRVTNHLTLNLGLRYELTTARRTNNGQDVNFNLITGNPGVGVAYNTYKGIDNLQPRLGFAWQPQWGGLTKNTVVRGAYGISTFMEANGVNNLPYQNPPFVQGHEVSYSGLALPNSTLDQGFSNFPASACTVAALQALSPACLKGATLHLTNPKLQPAVDQQWNLSIERQLGRYNVLKVGYVGNKIDHMSDIFIYNQKVLNPNGTTSPGPFAKTLINCCGAGNSPTIRFNDSSGIQRYNALQVSMEQREWKGLQYRANYTWSKCLNNSLGYFGPFGDEEALPGSTSQTGFSFFFQNAYNPLGDYGRCIADVASLFNGYLIYDLPFGKGKMFGGSVNNIANLIIGGWTLGSDFTLHTGFAITALGPDSSGTNSASPRANCPAGVPQDGSHAIVPLGGGQFGMQFWNPASAVPGAPGTFGTCAIGSFRGPGLATADLNLSKRFNLTERVNLQAMAQFINVTNTAILGRPSFFQGSTFGVISSSNPGRQIQFGFKANF